MNTYPGTAAFPRSRYLLTLALLTTASLPATSIVTVVGASTITIAADSVHAGSPDCKIRTANGLLFLTAGRVYDFNIGYDIRKLAESSSSGQKDIQSVINTLRQTVLKVLPTVVEAGIKDRALYELWTRASLPVPVVTVLFGTIDHGVPRIELCEFRIVGGSPTPDCKGAGPGGYFAMGVTATFSSVLSRDKDAAGRSMQSNPLQFTKAAVEIEIAASQLLGNDNVTPPVSTATFDTSGLHFRERGACPIGQKK